jgi:hypothetical protein
MLCDNSPQVYQSHRYWEYCSALYRTAKYLPPNYGYNVLQTTDCRLWTNRQEVPIANLPGKGNCRPTPLTVSALYGRAARCTPHREGKLKAQSRLFASPTDIYFVLRYEDSVLIGCISDY